MRMAVLELVAVALATFGTTTLASTLMPSAQQGAGADMPCIYCTEIGCSMQQPPCDVYTGCRAIGDSCTGCFCKKVRNECLCQ